jgi:membrane protein
MDAANRRDRNSIWANLWRWLGQRFFSLVIVLAIAFLLPVSLAVSAAMAGVAHYLQGPELTWTLFSRGLEVAVSILVITFLFAMLFRYVPDAEIHWRDV